MRRIADLFRSRAQAGSATRRWVASLPQEAATDRAWFADCIAMDAIVRWESWPRPLSEFNPVQSGGLPLPTARIATTRRVDAATLDLRQIVGFSASKSPLSELKTLDALANRLGVEKLVPTRDNLHRLLEHREIRVSVDGDGRWGDSLHRFGWERGVWVSNSGGSHHLAAAAIVARQIDADVQLSAPLLEHEIDAAAVRSFSDSWACFLVPQDEIAGLCDALEADRVLFGFVLAPLPFRDFFAVHLDRRGRRSVAAAAELETKLANVTQAAQDALSKQRRLHSESDTMERSAVSASL